MPDQGRTPTPAELWKRAEREVQGDDPLHRSLAIGDRYRELMREHGHLIPGKPEPLPCGWPEVINERDGALRREGGRGVADLD